MHKRRYVELPCDPCHDDVIHRLQFVINDRSLCQRITFHSPYHCMLPAVLCKTSTQVHAEHLPIVLCVMPLLLLEGLDDVSSAGILAL